MARLFRVPGVVVAATAAATSRTRHEGLSYAKSSTGKEAALDTPRGKESLQYTTLLRKRAVFLTGSITEETAKNIVAQLLYLEMDEPGKPITMLIQSGGGLVHPGFAIYDMMQFISSPVHTVCIGHAMSMGAVLLAAGEPGHRVALPNSRLMVHQSSLGVSHRTAQDVMIRAVEAQETKRRLVEALSRHSNQPFAAVNDAIERDNYMSPKDAIAFGIVDRVAQSIGDIHVQTGASGGGGGGGGGTSDGGSDGSSSTSSGSGEGGAPAKGAGREGYVR